MTDTSLKTALGRLEADLVAPDGGDATGVYTADLAKVLAVVKAAKELDREYENPAPDYTMRKHLRDMLKSALTALEQVDV